MFVVCTVIVTAEDVWIWASGAVKLPVGTEGSVLVPTLTTEIEGGEELGTNVP
jgi:hypothetical protein